MLMVSTAETLASILNRTTSLLPNALFASLGMPRGDENLGDAKHVRWISVCHCVCHIDFPHSRASIKSSNTLARTSSSCVRSRSVHLLEYGSTASTRKTQPAPPFLRNNNLRSHSQLKNRSLNLQQKNCTATSISRVSGIYVRMSQDSGCFWRMIERLESWWDMSWIGLWTIMQISGRWFGICIWVRWGMFCLALWRWGRNSRQFARKL